MLPAGLRSQYVTVLNRELHYIEAGDSSSTKVLLCWHGLARTCRDFDEIALHFSQHLGYRVIAPDLIGRGFSQWSPKPDEEYQLPFYAELAAALLEALNVPRCDWLGTSLGGLIAITGASTVLKGKIERLILNDIGPALSVAAIERIHEYAGIVREFDTMSDLEAFFRAAYKPFGPQSDAWFRKMTQAQSRRLPSGKVAPHYDPAIARMLRNIADLQADNSADLWAKFDGLRDVKVLAVRGGESDLLLEDGHAAMAARGLPSVRLATFAGVGHAPVFNVAAQIDVAVAFFTDKDGQSAP